MKVLSYILLSISLYSCSNNNSNNLMTDVVEVVKLNIPEMCENSKVYFVHPESCGACSMKLIQPLISKSKKAKCIYVITTGKFEPEFQKLIDTSKLKVYFIRGEMLFRKGINASKPQQMLIENNQFISIGILNI